MLDEKDLQAIAMLLNRTETTLKGDISRIEAVLKDDIARTETTLKGDISCIEAVLKDDIARTETTLKDDITHTANVLLDEIERYDRKYEQRFSDISKELNDLKEMSQFSRNESDTINMLLRIMENLEKRVSELEHKIA